MADDGRDDQRREFRAVIEDCPWLMSALAAVRESGLPDAWIGAGVLRDLVWGQRYGGGFAPRQVKDVDVAFFDVADLDQRRDSQATEQLRELRPSVPWEATNQAAVHTWYHVVFGGPPVAPLCSIDDAVATWPETATCVAVRIDPGGGIEVCAPFGLDDLLHGVWRHNPRRISVELSRRRLARHRPSIRWPAVRVIEPDATA